MMDHQRILDAMNKYISAHAAYVRLSRDVFDPTDERWATVDQELERAGAEYLEIERAERE